MVQGPLLQYELRGQVKTFIVCNRHCVSDRFPRRHVTTKRMRTSDQSAREASAIELQTLFVVSVAASQKIWLFTCSLLLVLPAPFTDGPPITESTTNIPTEPSELVKGLFYVGNYLLQAEKLLK